MLKWLKICHFLWHQSFREKRRLCATAK